LNNRPAVIRRVHVNVLSAGEFALQPDQAHHLRDVLRVSEGAEIELFDDSGATGRGTVVRSSPGELIVNVQAVQQPAAGQLQWVIASAVPKTARADWMIEKLSELGTAAFIPLSTARSVVHPKGENKRDRWERIAAESAKQSRRSGVLKIQPLMELRDAIKLAATSGTRGGYLSIGPHAQPIVAALQSWQPSTDLQQLLLFIGPEGGWTDDEERQLTGARLTPLALTATILRVETAAVAAASVVACLRLRPAERIA
jgi:16S rRNA (uracil1498-N3)-methyltransferase